MKARLKKRTLLVLGAVAALLAIAAGVSYAAIPAQDGTISSCTQKVAGIRYLRLIDVDKGETCKSTEQVLSWNKQGPAGAPGSPGSGNAYYAKLPINAPLSDDWETAAVASLTLPAGNYIVSALGLLDDASPNTASACTVGPPEAPVTAPPLDHEPVMVTITDTQERFALMAPVSWAGGQIDLRCKGLETKLWGGHLIATQVSSLTQQ